MEGGSQPGRHTGKSVMKVSLLNNKAPSGLRAIIAALVRAMDKNLMPSDGGRTTSKSY